MACSVSATQLGLRGSRGWVYRDVTFDAPPGAIVVVAGEAGSGRSSLLLTLAGRMRPTTGHAHVGEFRIPERLHAVQRKVGLGVFAGLNDLDDTLTVNDLAREQLALRGHLRHYVHGGEKVTEVLDSVGLDVAPRTYVRDLSPRDRMLLGIALGLVGQPDVIAVDNADAGMHLADQQRIWAQLATLAAIGITVLASCLDPGPATAALEAAAAGALVVPLPDRHALTLPESAHARA